MIKFIITRGQLYDNDSFFLLTVSPLLFEIMFETDLHYLRDVRTVVSLVPVSRMRKCIKTDKTGEIMVSEVQKEDGGIGDRKVQKTTKEKKKS